MKRDERNEFVVHLLCAERELAAAVSGLEGTDAAIETSVNALSRALDAIDAAL